MTLVRFKLTGIIVVSLLHGNVLAADNVFLITIDGLRWQEVFRGIDKNLATNEEFSEWSDTVMEKFWRDDPQDRVQALMPFLHNVVGKQGSMVGNRDLQSCARVSNPWYFSYPGYSEILTGIVDPKIDTNNKIPNPNRTFMELLLQDNTEYRNNMAVFSSWDVFPYIVNQERSGLYVNAYGLGDREDSYEGWLNQLQQDIPSPWQTVRFDAFTHQYALSYLRTHRPKVIDIAYGETDDFAHDGKYDQYVLAAHRTDQFIAELWNFINDSDYYRDNTIMFITVDHGRGEKPTETWQHHASKRSISGYMKSLANYPDGIIGSDAVWMAAIGPGIPSRGLIVTGDDCLTSNRIAATLLTLLGEDYKKFNSNMGKPLEDFLR